MPWPLPGALCYRSRPAMPSTELEFQSEAEHLAWLESQAALPEGFRVGTSSFSFVPLEAPKPASMTLTLIALDEPTPSFGAVFTRNAFPGAPVLIGRRRLEEPALAAILINNKISNVAAPDGEAASESLCEALVSELNQARAPRSALDSRMILPSSTGVIGWQLPAGAMARALPAAIEALQSESVLPAARGIMTTDAYPKVRSVKLGPGRLVGIAKGAGMIEPNLATMLVYLLTDIALERGALRALLSQAASRSFNRISIDSDMSTSDTVALVSSNRYPCEDEDAFRVALHTLCADLAEDVVRNGEGVRHVLAVTVSGAPEEAIATGIARSVVNAPLFKCAVAGNDPNVGRLLQAVGKWVGAHHPELDLGATSIAVGGITVLRHATFALDPNKEAALVAYLKHTELYPGGGAIPKFPAHERRVEVTIDLGLGESSSTVLGADLTHEYVSENADYRS
jgi:glutamate N-acetyltransferase/amino-acid N-acetyltransferase